MSKLLYANNARSVKSIHLPFKRFVDKTGFQNVRKTEAIGIVISNLICYKEPLNGGQVLIQTQLSCFFLRKI
jgi:hypothetical protein